MSLKITSDIRLCIRTISVLFTVIFNQNTNPTDVSIDTVNSEEQMAGSHITKFHTPKDKEIVLEDLLSQVNQNFNN